MKDRRRKGEKTGRWQWSAGDILVCEYCRSVCLYPDYWRYCPRCGARMDPPLDPRGHETIQSNGNVAQGR